MNHTNKLVSLFTLSALLLSACAPTVTGPIQGRIVNVATGVEGQVSIVRDTLYARYNGAQADNNVMITIGDKTFTGKTVLVDTGIATVGGGWNSSVWADSYWTRPYRTVSGWGYHPLPMPTRNEVVSRSGNLIARSGGDHPVTLTCTLSVTNNEHGTGECQSSDRNKYSMQF